jgi:O-antigen/teichoic acid export membrane protein
MLLLTDFVNSALVKFAARFMSKERNKSIKGLVKTGMFFEVATVFLMFLILWSLADLPATYVINRPMVTHLVWLASLTILGDVLFLTSGSIFVGLDQTD